MEIIFTEKKDKRTPEKQLMDFDKSIGFKTGFSSKIRSDFVRIIEKLGLE